MCPPSKWNKIKSCQQAAVVVFLQKDAIGDCIFLPPSAKTHGLQCNCNLVAAGKCWLDLYLNTVYKVSTETSHAHLNKTTSLSGGGNSLVN